MTPAGLVIRSADEVDLSRIVELLVLGVVPGGPPSTEDPHDLGPYRAALHDIVMAINYFNPLAYLNGVHENGSGTTTMTGIIPLGVPARTALVWLLAIVSSGLAITFYRRAEE